MKFKLRMVGLVALVFAAFGCADEVLAPDGHGHEEVLAFGLTFSTADIYTLSEVTVTLNITDDHGAAMTEFDNMEAQYRLVGSTQWDAGVAMMLQGAEFMGAHTFVASGEYEFRIMGVPHHGGEHGHAAEELHHVHEHVHVERAYVEAGGYRIEYESSPGHVHEGLTPILTFWVMEKGMDSSGNHPPIVGLNATIRCTEANGMIHNEPAVETAPGVYEAPHTILSPGDARVALLFTGSDSNPAEAEFNIHVDHEH